MGTNHRAGPAGSGHDIISAIAAPFRSPSPIAAEGVARDVAECSGDEAEGAATDSESDLSSDAEPGPTLYRRPSGVAYGPSTRPTINELGHHEPQLSHAERKQSREAERALLRDNHILSDSPELSEDEGGPTFTGLFKRLFKRKAGGKLPEAESRAVGYRPDETSPLLSSRNGESHPRHGHLNEQWNEAVAEGRIQTTWIREVKVLSRHSTPLFVAFMLQYSINVTSIFAVGRIGKMELGAVSLATMTAVITCYAPFIGLATSLDTLCAQAYGSGHKHLVGLQFQRMSYFLVLCFIPIGVIWYHGESILALVVPERRSAELAGQYLRILIVSGPFSAVFEAAKRYVQAQGLFNAATWVLLVAAPINILVNWLLVWKLEWGYVGAPVAVCFTQMLLPIFLFLYVKFVDGYQCWGGFSKKAFVNWGAMIRLAIPGMIMVEAEYLAFEVLTIGSSRFGPQYLAAQSVVNTLEALAYQIPFALSVAASTRIANLIGAGLVDAARISAQVTVLLEILVGIINCIITLALRHKLVWLFTQDPEVSAIAASLLLVIAVLQLLDGTSTGAHGILRGIGQQYIGSYANLGGFYLVGLPVAFGTAFGLGWKVHGLWFGLTVGLLVVTVVEYWFAYAADWKAAAREAESRNEAG